MTIYVSCYTELDPMFRLRPISGNAFSPKSEIKLQLICVKPPMLTETKYGCRRVLRELRLKRDEPSFSNEDSIIS